MRSLILASILGLAGVLHGNSSSLATWARVVETGSSNHGYAVAATGDGGAIVAGSADGIVLIKFRASGEVEWTRRYGTSRDGYPARIAASRDGWFVLGRAWLQRNPEPPSLLTGWIMKLDHAGAIQWHQFLDSPELNELTDLAVTDDGGCLVVGRAVENVSLILKLDRSGKIDWQRTFDVAGLDIFESVIRTRDGGFLAGGRARYSPWLMKLNSRGELEWQRNYRAAEGFARVVRETADGGFVVAASVGQRPSDVRIFKITKKGQPEWDRLFQTNEHDDVFGLQVTSEGSLIVAGTTAVRGASDIFLMKLSADGKPIWQRSFGAEGSEPTDEASLAMDGQGSLFLAVGSESFSPIGSLLLIKTNQSGELSQCALTHSVSFERLESPIAAAEVLVSDSGIRVAMKPRVAQRFAAELASRPVCPDPTVRVAETQHPTPAAVAAGTPSAGTESKARSDLVEQVSGLVLARRFDELDRLAMQLRTSKSKFPSGQPKLSFFYDGLLPSLINFDVASRDAFLRILEDWSRANPRSLTPRIALANAYLVYAYEARGESYADAVTEEAWKEFQRLNERARVVLKEATSLALNDPAYYKSLLELGRVTSADRAHLVSAFERGVEIDPSYYGLYYGMAMSLLPRWGGEPGEVERFAAEMADRTKTAMGDSLYTRLAFWVQNMEGAADTFYKSHNFSWPRVIKGFRDLERQFPSANLNQHLFLRLACGLSDREILGELFRRPNLRWDADAQAVFFDQKSFEACRALASGPASSSQTGTAVAAKAQPQPQLKIPEPAAKTRESALGHFTKGWPPLLLRNRIELQDGSLIESGYSFLIRDQDGKIAAVTAITVLPREKLTNPQMLRAIVDEWTLIPQTPKSKKLSVDLVLAGAPLNKNPGSWIAGVVFSVPGADNSGIRPLELRSVPTQLATAVYIPHCHFTSQKICNQVVHPGTVFSRSVGTGKTFASLMIRVDEKIEPSEIVGSPVIDDEGKVIGVVYAGQIPPADSSLAGASLLDVEELGKTLAAIE